MPVFHWGRSTALQNYQTGDIIVDAPDVTTARLLATTHAASLLRRDRSYYFEGGSFSDAPAGTPVHEDSREEYDQWMARLAADLAVEPAIITVLFLEGGE